MCTNFEFYILVENPDPRIKVLSFACVRRAKWKIASLTATTSIRQRWSSCAFNVVRPRDGGATPFTAETTVGHATIAGGGATPFTAEAMEFMCVQRCKTKGWWCHAFHC